MIATVIIAAAVAVLAVAGDDGQEEANTGAAGSAAPGDVPAAPWRATAVARPDVPPAYVTAWDRARNRATCALLFPLDGGPGMEEADATEQRTPDDVGWDVFRSAKPGTVEVLGAFPKGNLSSRSPSSQVFTKTWTDGSVAKYGPEPGPGAPPADLASVAHEAELTLPDQGCVYQVYDTLGKDHLEAVFDRLRLMAR